jgi:hypothetical protein
MASSSRAIYVYQNGKWVDSPTPSIYISETWVTPSAGWVFKDNQWQQFYPSTGALPYILANSQFTFPSWVPHINIVLIGGGGAGGSGITGPNGGGGGGGGGQIVVQHRFSVTPGAVYKFIIGQGGLPPEVNSGLAGSAGGDTVMTDAAGNILLIAHGGGGGGGAKQAPVPIVGGAAGGGAGSGDLGVQQGALGSAASGAGWSNNKWDLGGGGGGANFDGAVGHDGGSANVVNGAGGAGSVVIVPDKDGNNLAPFTFSAGGAGGYYIFKGQADPKIIGANKGGVGGGGGPGQNATNFGSGGGGSIGTDKILSAGAGYQGAAYVYW